MKGIDIFVSPTRGTDREIDAATGDRKSSREAAIAKLAPAVVVIEVRFDQEP